MANVNLILTISSTAKIKVTFKINKNFSFADLTSQYAESNNVLKLNNNDVSKNEEATKDKNSYDYIKNTRKSLKPQSKIDILIFFY